MELLRIVAMSMVVIHHFICHGGLDHTFPGTKYLEVMSICGVDLFVMISGWFTIRLSRRSVVRLVVTTFYFTLITMVLYRLVEGEPSRSWASTLLYLLFPVSKSRYWFIATYMALMLVSPLLNEAIRRFSLRRLGGIVVLLVAFNAYSCCVGDNHVDHYGYSLYNFICCYMAGAWLSRARRFTALKVSTRTLVAVIAAMALLKVAFLYFSPAITSGFIRNQLEYSCFKYSSLPVFGMSMCLLVVFGRMRFQSTAVNKVASVALGVYLLQDGDFGGPLYGRIYMMFTHSMAYRLTLIVGTFVGLWVASYLLYIPLRRLLARIAR